MRSPPTKINFTKSAIESLELPAPPAERRYVYDLKTAGLTIAVFPTGTRVFYLYRRIKSGRIERVKIGPWPHVTVEQARTQAAELNGRVGNGENPNDKRRAQRSAPTFQAIFDSFIEAPTRTKAKRPKAAKTIKDYRQQFETYLAPWHARQLSTVTRPDVERLHNELSKSSGLYTANRVLGLIKSLYNFAMDQEWFAANPAARVTGFEEQTRDRFLQADEFPKFWAALEAESPEVSDKARDFIKLALFTGQRRTNVLAMRWSDVNLDRALWTIPQTKTGRHSLPLTNQALELLKRREQSRDGSEFVFPAHHGATGYMQDPMRAWRDILTRAGIENLRIHDLRRSMGSWQAKTGSSLPIIGKTMGHSQAQTTLIYGRLDADPVLQSMQTATAAMMAAAKPKAKRRSKQTA